MQEFEGTVPDASRGASSRLEIALEPDPHGVRVRIVGELDLATAPQLDRMLQDVASNGHGRVLIDLDGVKFMDSTGLASIVRAQRHADSNGHRVALRAGSPQVQRLFEITGMLDLLIFED